MVNITQRPTRTVDILSRWTAAHNPVIYKFSRRDREVTAIIVSGSYLRLSVDSTGIVVGNKIYVGATKYKGVGTVVNVSSGVVYVSGFNVTLGDDGTGYINLSLRNYRIEISIYESGSNALLGLTSCVPFTNGAGTKDVGKYVSAYLKLQNTFAYDALNKRDTNGSIKFYITYKETYTGGGGDLVSDAAQPIYAVNAAKQIGDVNGQNMAEFVAAYPTTRTAKFLTKFKRPVYFEGLPFSIGFIYSELLGVQITKEETQLDVNMATQSVGYDNLDPEQKEGVNSLMLAGSYPANTRFVELQLLS